MCVSCELRHGEMCVFQVVKLVPAEVLQRTLPSTVPGLIMVSISVQYGFAPASLCNLLDSLQSVKVCGFVPASLCNLLDSLRSVRVCGFVPGSLCNLLDSLRSVRVCGFVPSRLCVCVCVCVCVGRGVTFGVLGLWGW